MYEHLKSASFTGTSMTIPGSDTPNGTVVLVVASAKDRAMGSHSGFTYLDYVNRFGTSLMSGYTPGNGTDKTIVVSDAEYLSYHIFKGLSSFSYVDHANGGGTAILYKGASYTKTTVSPVGHAISIVSNNSQTYVMGNNYNRAGSKVIGGWVGSDNEIHAHKVMINEDITTLAEDTANVIADVHWITMTLVAAESPSGNIKVRGSLSWLTKPVKVRIGSNLVHKPLKRWNGTAWTRTRY